MRSEKFEIAGRGNSNGDCSVDFEERGFQFREGDRVRIREGSFEDFEGKVSSVDIAGTVTVLVTIFGRVMPVEVEFWQLESVNRIE